MVFESKGFQVDLVGNKDLDIVAKVYNSNSHFLVSHMNKERVTNKWILEELQSMKELGFYCCKIVEISSGNVIGILDFKPGKEIYLSLVMMDNNFQGKGFGKLIFESFEEYAKSLKSECIRIDVVTNYDNSVLDFWIKIGFVKYKDVELNWTGKTLPAVTMKKKL